MLSSSRLLLAPVVGLAAILTMTCGGDELAPPPESQPSQSQADVSPSGDIAAEAGPEETTPGAEGSPPVLRARSNGRQVTATLNAADWEGPTGPVELPTQDGLLTAGAPLEIETRDTVYLEGYPNEAPAVLGVSIDFWEQSESGPTMTSDGFDQWDRAERAGSTLDVRATASPRFTVPLWEGSYVVEATLFTGGGSLVYAFTLRVVLPPPSPEALRSFGTPSATSALTGESVLLQEVLLYDDRPLPPRWPEFLWWSPQSATVAQADSRGLWVTGVPGGEPQLVFAHDKIRWAAWHPSGERLAAETSDGVFVVGLDGAARQVWLSGAGVAWSADGRLAFMTEGDLVVLDGERAETTTIPGQCGGPRWVGADRLALTCGDDNTWGVVFVEDGSISARVQGQGGTPYISPDGTRIAVQTRDEGRPVVRVLDDDGVVVQELEGVIVGSGHSSFVEDPYGTDQGPLLVMERACSAETALAIWTVSGERTEVWRSDPETLFGFVFTAVWSTDGSQLAFTTPPSATEPETLWLVPADGSAEARAVAVNVAAPLGARWSADGQWLAYWPATLLGGYDWCT